MKLTIATIAMLAMAVPVYAQGADDVPGRKAGQPTSDRTPQQKTTTPLDQTTQTKQGATSDRTPSNNQMGGQSDMGMQHSGTDAQMGSSGQQAQGGPNTGRPSVLTPAKLRESLEKAGFKDIQVLDAAYLVHARNSDGDLIVMTINPPTIAAATGVSGASESSTGGRSPEGRAFNPPSESPNTDR
jgi:hypothetical protein